MRSLWKFLAILVVMLVVVAGIIPSVTASELMPLNQNEEYALAQVECAQLLDLKSGAQEVNAGAVAAGVFSGLLYGGLVLILLVAVSG